MPGGRVDDYIIEEGSKLAVGTEDSVHELLECRWGPVEPKGENPMAQWPLAVLKVVFGLALCERHLPLALSGPLWT